MWLFSIQSCLRNLLNYLFSTRFWLHDLSMFFLNMALMSSLTMLRTVKTRKTLDS